MNTIKQKTMNFLKEERQGAESLEWVVLVALALMVVIVFFSFVVPSLQHKAENAAQDIEKAGTTWKNCTGK